MEGSESPIQIPGTKHIWVYIQVRYCTAYMVHCTLYTVEIPGTKHLGLYSGTILYSVHGTWYTVHYILY